jgi:hypothetical protein
VQDAMAPPVSRRARDGVGDTSCSVRCRQCRDAVATVAPTPKSSGMKIAATLNLTRSRKTSKSIYPGCAARKASQSIYTAYGNTCPREDKASQRQLAIHGLTSHSQHVIVCDPYLGASLVPGAPRSGREIFQRIKPGPRVRMAARLYASGAVPTKRAACEAVGLHPAYLTMLRENPEVVTIISEVDRAISDKNTSLSELIQLMARKAAQKLNSLVDSNNEHVALKAVGEVLDRTPETSRTMKHQVTSFKMESSDAAALALALVEGARAKEKFIALASGDFVKVDTDQETSDGSQEAGNGDKQGHIESVPIEVLDEEAKSRAAKAEGNGSSEGE